MPPRWVGRMYYTYEHGGRVVLLLYYMATLTASDDTRIVLTVVPTDMRAVPLDIKVYRVVCHGAKGTNDIGVHGPVHPRGPSQSVSDPTLSLIHI